MTTEECYRLGNITKPFGYKGQMVFYLDVDTPDNYADLDSAFVEVKGSLVPYFFHIDSINGNKAVVPNSRATNSTSTKWSGSR